jgi:hypothetical protein
MSYEMKCAKMKCTTSIIDRNLAVPPNIQELASSPLQSLLVKKSNNPLTYSQCGDVFNTITFLSRSLNRMRINHAITGRSAIALMSLSSTGPLIKALSSSPGSSIELIMSARSYEHFLSVCIHQRIKPMPENDRTFWDHRTGCTLKIYVVGDRLKFGRRTITVPQLDTLVINDDGIKSWIIKSKTSVASRSRSRKALSSLRSEKKAMKAA